MPQLKPKQSDLFARTIDAKRTDRFGGNQRRSRASRRARPISIKSSMHLMLKSLHAKGAWSFLTPKNKKIVQTLMKRFAEKYGIQILSLANVGNHLHIHMKSRSHSGFKAFVRAFTGTLALKITGANKFKRLEKRFWTQTPYTRFVHGLTDYLRLKDYFEINQIEGFGVPRVRAEIFIGHINRVRQRFRRFAEA